MQMFGLAIIILLILGVFFLAFQFSRKKSLTESKKEYYRSKLTRVQNLSDREAIMEYDKILAHILTDYGYVGTVADQLKKQPRVLSDIQEVWRLHKLRNRIAHEIGEVHIGKNDRKAFESILTDLLT